MTKITVETTIDAPVEKVWEFYTETKHVTKWNNASEDWHTPWAKNDLRVGGKFVYRMEAKDGSAGFDFNGIYDEVNKYEIIAYTIEGGRKVKVVFTKRGEETTHVKVTFDPENENPIEMQRDGWQAILNNFKDYVEEN